jgi:hypothetical protein
VASRAGRQDVQRLRRRPVADFLRRLTFAVLLGDNDAHAKNVAILHLSGQSVLADMYDAVPNLFQVGRIDCNLALGTGEAERIITATLADFAKVLDRVTVPPGVPAPATAQLAPGCLGSTGSRW